MDHKKSDKPAIAMQAVKSSMLQAHGYDPASKTLAVKFTNGDTWHYPDVAPEVAQGLATADSAGKFFGAHIRSKFKGTKQ